MTIEEQLREQGLRRAMHDEAGWYTLVETKSGEVRKVWATDEPLKKDGSNER